MVTIHVRSLQPSEHGRVHWLYKPDEVEFVAVLVRVNGRRTLEFDPDIEYTPEELEEIVRIAKTLPFD